MTMTMLRMQAVGYPADQHVGPLRGAWQDVPVMLLVAADPLHPRRPDEHFAPEADAAREAGIEVTPVDHDALSTPGAAARAVARVPSGGDAVYRGWMLRSRVACRNGPSQRSPAQYDAFAAALADRGATLRSTPRMYRTAHELPGWYPTLAEFTPRSVWTLGVDRGDFEQACRALGPGPAVLRDYVKSMKHHWHQAAYIPDLADRDAAWRVAQRFLQLRDDDLVGGLVLRRFEHFATAELRTWWIGGRCRLVGPHPDTPDQTPAQPDPAVLDRLGGPVAALDLPFVTVDLAQRGDGVWRVIELGDGQVSDRPASTPADTFITAITGSR